MPFVLSWIDFYRRLISGEWVATTIDPCVPKVRRLEDVPNERRTTFECKRVKSYELIKPVLNLGWGAYYKHSRGEKVADIASGRTSGKTHSECWIRELLLAYWRSGCDPFSLGPDYSNCGAPSREKRLQAGIDEGKEIICPRRSGPNYRTLPSLNRNEELALDPIGRGGVSIHPRAVPIIIRLINGYLNDPMNRAAVNISRNHRKGLSLGGNQKVRERRA